jgi:hypothetical protein
MVPVSRKSERIKINIRVSMSDEIARCLGLGRQVVPDLYQISDSESCVKCTDACQMRRTSRLLQCASLVGTACRTAPPFSL